MYNYEDYLMHYGIKGMKWGIRRFQNKDGSLTDAGKKRMSDTIVRKFDKNPDKTPGDMINTLKRDPNIKRAHIALTSSRKELDEVMQFEYKFDKNQELVNKYREKAANRIGKENGYSKRDIQRLFESMRDDDADFGNYYSFDEYCRDNGTTRDTYYKKCTQAQIKYHNKCKDYTNSLLGEYGEATAWQGINSRRSVSDVVANTLRAMGEEKYY